MSTFSEARIGDDGIDDEQVDSRVRDVVRMVVTVKSDSHFRPVQEEGGRQLYGEDLSMLSLTLAHGETRRGSLVNHEAVMDLGKPLIFIVIFLLGVLFLVIPLDAYSFKVLAQHVAVLEVVVRGSLMVGTWFFEHFIENAPAGGVLGASCGQRQQ
jgi:hypothetical protein